MNQLLDMINCCAPIESGEKTRAQIRSAGNASPGSPAQEVHARRRGVPNNRDGSVPTTPENGQRNGYHMQHIDQSDQYSSMALIEKNDPNTSLSQHQW